MEEERRKTIRRANDTECPHNCNVCYRYNLQMKWLLAGAGGAVAVFFFFGTVILENKADIGVLANDAGVAKVQAEYTVESINDIKRAMGLEVRMPPRLEALKGGQ